MWPEVFKHLVPFVNQTNKQIKASHSNGTGQRHFPAKLLKGLESLGNMRFKGTRKLVRKQVLSLSFPSKFLTVTRSLRATLTRGLFSLSSVPLRRPFPHTQNIFFPLGVVGVCCSSDLVLLLAWQPGLRQAGYYSHRAQLR